MCFRITVHDQKRNNKMKWGEKKSPFAEIRNDIANLIATALPPDPLIIYNTYTSKKNIQIKELFGSDPA